MFRVRLRRGNLFFIVFNASLIFLFASCSGSSKNDAKTTYNKWKPPQLTQSGGYVDTSTVQPLAFCDIYLMSDAFVYGEIKSISFSMNPFIFRSEFESKLISEYHNEEIDTSTCDGVSPALKIDIEVKSYSSFYRFDHENLISVYISLEDLSMLEPKPYPNMRLSETENPTVSMDSDEVIWLNRGTQTVCDSNIESDNRCPMVVGDYIGMPLFFQESVGVWYAAMYPLFWAENIEWIDPQPGSLKFDFSNFLRVKSLDDMNLLIESCSGANFSFDSSFRQKLKDDDWLKTVPICTRK